MPGVILVLGLIAAGIYTENAWFYMVASVIGFFYFLVMFLILAVAASVKSGVDDINKRKLR